MTTLSAALAAIDWAGNIATSLAHDDTEAKIGAAALRLAVWSNQLEILDAGNPALSFIREMQIAIQNSGVLVSLCLYKPSAASSRTLVETCLYYTFFRNHPAELATLANDPKYYVSKADIVDHHKLHTPWFKTSQAVFGLVGRLETWYSTTSAIVHGQVPGAWNAHSAITNLLFSEEAHKLALLTILDAEQLAHEWLLCTAGRDLWAGFAPDAKSLLLEGISGAAKTGLGLDSK